MSKRDFFSGPEPRLFAHRGASACAPENTLDSFRLAWEAGAPYLELDVHLTGDDRLVVIHDSSVSRTTGRRGRVENMTLDAIRRLDAGCQFSPDWGRTFPYRGRGLVIPTLEEVLEAFPQARLTIEIKRTRGGVEEKVAEAIQRCSTEERVIVASLEHRILERFRALEGGVHTSFSKSEVREFLSRVRGKDWRDYRPPAPALQVPEYFGLRRVVSPAVIEVAHHLGLEVHVWTVNEPVHIQRLLHWGVDGVMTDDPARALSSVEGLREMARAEGRC
ncbi:MAG: glycerophosphodiester phosphodiesterase [Acidobacteriota bacterium]